MATFYPGDLLTDAQHDDHIVDGYGHVWRMYSESKTGTLLFLLDDKTGATRTMRRITNADDIIEGETA